MTREELKKLENSDLLGKLPPQAIDLEEAVLGAMLLEGKSLIEILPSIPSEKIFYKEPNRIIFLGVRRLFSQGYPIDLLTLTNELRKSAELEVVGGAYYLTQLTTKVNSAAHINEYIEILKEKALLRDLIDLASILHKEAFDDTCDASSLLDLLSLRVMEVQDGLLPQINTGGKAIYLDAMKKIAKAMETPGMTGLASGLTELDKMTGGWQNDDLIILAARPGMGKTALMTTSVKHAVLVLKKPVAVFSLEMSAFQLMLRLISDEAEISGAKMKKGYTTPEEYLTIQNTSRHLYTDLLQIDDTPAISILELRAKAIRLKMKYPDLAAIFVDYLQLMSGSIKKPGGNREQEISEISRGLKKIAKELGIPVIALSQLSRSVESRGGDKRPQLSDLRESGAIEQDADVVAFLYRPEYYKIYVDEDGNSLKGIGEVIFAKHRNGPCDSVHVGFDGPSTKFYNLDERREQVSQVQPSNFGYRDPTESKKVSALDQFDANGFDVEIRDEYKGDGDKAPF